MVFHSDNTIIGQLAKNVEICFRVRSSRGATARSKQNNIYFTKLFNKFWKSVLFLKAKSLAIAAQRGTLFNVLIISTWNVTFFSLYVTWYSTTCYLLKTPPKGFSYVFWCKFSAGVFRGNAKDSSWARMWKNTHKSSRKWGKVFTRSYSFCGRKFTLFSLDIHSYLMTNIHLFTIHFISFFFQSSMVQAAASEALAVMSESLIIREEIGKLGQF